MRIQTLRKERKVMKLHALFFGVLALVTAPLYSQPDNGTARQTLTVGSSIPFAPYVVVSSVVVSVVVDPLVVSGFDADVACALRDRLNFNNVQFKNVFPFDFSALASGLTTGTFTIVMGGISMTPQNLAIKPAIKYSDDTLGVLYSTTFLNSLAPDLRALLENPEFALDALGGLDMPIGVPAQSGALQFLQDSGVNVVVFSDVASAVAALNAQTIIAYVANSAVATTAVQNFPLIPLFAVPNVDAPGYQSLGLGIFVDPSSCQLYVDILAAINAMAADGTLAALQKKWGTGPFTPLSMSQIAMITPAACLSTQPNLLTRCPILQFAFEKYCTCMPQLVAS
jgi:ABC-type amino acid transport substrate-binding protein